MTGIPPRSTDAFLNEFTAIARIVPKMTPHYRKHLDRLVSFLADRNVLPIPARRRAFIANINRKLSLNSPQLRRFYHVAAVSGCTLHYHDKNEVESAFNLNDSRRLARVLERKKVSEKVRSRLVDLVVPVDEATTIRQIALECQSPSKLRKSGLGRAIDAEISMSIFSAFMWESLPPRQMHEFFDPHFSDKEYTTSFWRQLRLREPLLFPRQNALHVVRVTRDAFTGVVNYDTIRSSLEDTIARLYDVLDNYGFVAVVIERLDGQAFSREWRLAAESILFAEKHRESKLDKPYFRSRRVAQDTQSHVLMLDSTRARFDLANEGFTYRDTFVLTIGDTVSRLAILFQKNRRDETIIPCPACRSYDVRGNSYSTLGVKSWECMNVLCPDRSRYNRGKRYSLRSLLMQESIRDHRSEVPVESVRRWRRDVVSDRGDADLIEMLVRHYSMEGDRVHVYNWDTIGREVVGRKIEHHPFSLTRSRHRFGIARFSRGTWSKQRRQRYRQRTWAMSDSLCT